MNKEFPCECGHLESNHKGFYGDCEGYCRMCSFFNISPIVHDFKIDNLRYLESLVNKND